jgi:hypothetical protein
MCSLFRATRRKARFLFYPARMGILRTASLVVVFFSLTACTTLDALLATTTPTPTLPSSAVLEERLPWMILQSTDLPPGFVAWSESYQRNEEILAETGGDPNVARFLRNSGRQTGYLVFYQALEPDDSPLEGIFVVLELFGTPEQASEALYRDPRQVTGVNMRQIPVEHIGDESIAYTTVAQGSTVYAVWFRLDRLTAAVYTSNQGDGGSLEESRAFAERLLGRMKEQVSRL